MRSIKFSTLLMVFTRRMTLEVTFTVDLGSPKNIYSRPLTTSIISKKNQVSMFFGFGGVPGMTDRQKDT